MNINERLELLQVSGTISKETCKLVQQLIIKTREQRKITLTEENAAALVTHMAMARDRILKGEIAAPIDAAIMEEIKGSPDYEKATAIVKEWDELLGIVFPEAEKGYLLLHLCTLLAQEAD